MMWDAGEALWALTVLLEFGILPVVQGCPAQTVAQTASAPKLRDQTNLGVMILILIQSDFRRA